MIFTITVKSQQKRVARVDACKRVVLLLADSTEAPTDKIVHRDPSYLNRLNGTCFKCEACAIEEIPESPLAPRIGGEGCGLIATAYSCACDGVNAYPIPTTTLGSGFWIGLPQSSFYTNVINGGWVVAVSCLTGQIVGAFPVTGLFYGYGVGTILGISVMIYPAGVVYGAGFVPAHETTYPILALTTTEGNNIVSTGFNITQAALGCPVKNTTYFCPIEDSFVYEGEITPCLEKFGGESGCALFDDFRVNADGVVRGGDYQFNLIETSFVGGATATGVIQFTSTDGQKYCGSTINAARVQTDALSGICGGTPWPDPVTKYFDNCVDCTGEVSIHCQYLANLTNGTFNIDYGGYSAASSGGFFGIGPSNAPKVADQQITNSNYWETFWEWTITEGTTTGTISGNLGIIPPIGQLIANCYCVNSATVDDAYAFIEKFKCCNEDLPPTQSEEAEAYTIVKIMGAGLGCNSGDCDGGRSLAAACSCAARETALLLGSPRAYEYVPCTVCPCGNQSEGIPPTQSNIVSGIWWLNSAGGMTSWGGGDPTIPTPGGECMQRCSNSIYNRINCRNPCSSLLLPNTGGTQLNLSNFLACTGFSTPQAFLDDPCARTFFFPSNLINCDMIYTDPEPNSTIPYVFGERIRISDTDCSVCDDGPVLDCIGMCYPDDENCYLHWTHGPLSFASTTCDGADLDMYTVLTVPTIEQVQIIRCDDEQVWNNQISFVKVKNDLCDGTGEDPCRCCTGVLGTVGEGPTSTGAVLCGDCDPCCQGDGCFDTVDGCPVPIDPDRPPCNTSPPPNGGGGGPAL